MFGWLRRLRSWRPGPAGGLADDATGAIAGLLTLGACVAADVALVQRVGRDRRARSSPRRSSPRCWPARWSTAGVGAARVRRRAGEPAAGTWRPASAEQVVRLARDRARRRARGRRRVAARALGRALRAPAPARLRRRGRRRVAAARRDPAPGHRRDRAGVQRHLHDRRDPRGRRVADRRPSRRPRRRGRGRGQRCAGRPPALPEWLVSRRALLAAPAPVVAARRRRGAAPDGAPRTEDLEFLRAHRPALVDRDPDPRPRPQPRRPDPDHRLVGARLRRRGRALRARSSPAGSAWRSTTPACSPTSRASSGGWTP